MFPYSKLLFPLINNFEILNKNIFFIYFLYNYNKITIDFKIKNFPLAVFGFFAQSYFQILKFFYF